MFRTSSEKCKRERLLLSKRSLETSPPELRQLLAYVLHLRSHWKPGRRAKLIVPASWMEFLPSADGKCGAKCGVDRRCPFRHVRFESGAEMRLVGPGEELPRDVVSQTLANAGTDNRLMTLVPRAFEDIRRTRLMSDMPSTHRSSQNTSSPISFALVSGCGRDGAENVPSERNTRCLLLGMKKPTQTQSTSLDPRSEPCPLASIPEELTNQGQFHLQLLASLIKREAVGTTTEVFPEWLVLFGLVYDAHHVRVVAYVPRRRALDVIECPVYIVDELSFHSTTGASTCEIVLECLRFLLALTTLRQHVRRLSNTLFATVGSRDGIRRADHRPSLPVCLARDRHHPDDFDPLDRCSSLGSKGHGSSEYSTCPSSVRTRELSYTLALESGDGLSSCQSFTSSFCSTCSSLSEGASTSDSLYSVDSRYTNPGLLTTSLLRRVDKNIPHLHRITEAKRRDIVAWARQVEHPVKDTYRMVTDHSHPRRQKVIDSMSGTRRWTS